MFEWRQKLLIHWREIDEDNDGFGIMIYINHWLNGEKIKIGKFFTYFANKDKYFKLFDKYTL